MIKLGSKWVQSSYPHKQYIIGNKKMTVSLDGPDEHDPIGDIILYNLRPRIPSGEPGDSYIFVKEIELRRGWWEVEEWEKDETKGY